MKFVCLVYLEESTMQALTPAEQRSLDERSLAYDRDLARKGHLIAAEALQPVTAAKTIKARQDSLSVTDGPFAETKEHLGGFILLNARDLDEAVQIAGKIPIAQLGTIEVRPIMTIGG